ncbi:SGNH/GDSL hydrolase family protein [Spirulina subsalsa]|uniref:SGNH/GDSL hydrolase family protein n=1 Tax=Spirulina subsalsa TaxID=54311 RepID=UPI0002D2B9E5|nr:SGNH/GDSL hydrolase family protein [Spirulina subsalsa]
MFKSYKNPYYNRRRQRFAFPWKLIAFIIVGLIVLELLTRLFLGLTTPRETSPEILNAYQYQVVNREQEPIAGLPQKGELAIQPSLGVGYQLVGDQESAYWTINQDRFRDEREIPRDKPANEIRIFLLGGSAAFGQWLSSQNDTLSHYLERRINERLEQQQRSPEKYRPPSLPFDATGRANALALPPRIRSGEYRVINAAVPGYASGNELAQLALKILPYKPDVVVLLDGYEDIMLPHEQEAVQIPQMEAFLNDPPAHFWAYLTQPVKRFFGNTTLLQAIANLFGQPPSAYEQRSLVLVGDDSQPLVEHLPGNEEELEQRLARYRQNIIQMVQLCAGANVPLVVALQPEITGISEEQLNLEVKAPERAIVEQLGTDYVEQARQAFRRLGEVNDQIGAAFPRNVKILNYYQLFDRLSDVAFQDAVHLNAKGNSTLAERFYNAISTLPRIQVQIEDPLAR